jgi:HK97 family phage major capsid protein
MPNITPTLDSLRSMSANQLAAAIGSIDAELAELNLTQDGEVRSDLSEADLDRGEALLNLAKRAEATLRAREQFDRHPGSVQTAVAGDRGGQTSGRDREFGEARRTIDAAVRSGLLPDHAAEKATNLVEQGSTSDRSLAARWATATGDPQYLTCFAKLCSDPVRGHLLWDSREQAAFQRVAEVQAEFRAMSLTDAAGGFMVPFTLDPAILLTSAGSINPLRQVARVETTVTDQWAGVTSAGVTSEWKAEAAEMADASPTLAQPNIPVHLGDAFTPFSYEIGMDAPNFLSELQKILLDSAAQLQNTAYTTGTGTGQPKGVITAGIVGGTSVVTSATTDVFAKADVYNLQNALPPRFSANASWLASLPILNLMSQMETTAGARLFPELSEGRLLNKPISELSNLDNVINAAQENYILVYGSFRDAFVIVDRIGTTLELIPNLLHVTTNRPSGQRGAVLWFRTGSDVVVLNGLRILNVT